MTDPLFQRAADGQVYYYQNDHLGTPQRLIKSNGATVWWATYTAFGEASVDPDSSIENNLRFPGQYYDQETGLHYNYFRDYDPSIGRYIQSDPIGLEGGINTYAYVGGNPLSYIDPDGLQMAIPIPMPMVRPIPTIRPGTLVDPFVIPGDPNQPNGQSEECRKLLEKIQNTRKEIYDKRYPDLQANPGNLPYRIGPGEKLSETVRGHEKLLNRRLNELKKLEDKYEEKCGAKFC